MISHFMCREFCETLNAVLQKQEDGLFRWKTKFRVCMQQGLILAESNQKAYLLLCTFRENTIGKKIIFLFKFGYILKG